MGEKEQVVIQQQHRGGIGFDLSFTIKKMEHMDKAVGHKAAYLHLMLVAVQEVITVII